MHTDNIEFQANSRSWYLWHTDLREKQINYRVQRCVRRYLLALIDSQRWQRKTCPEAVCTPENHTWNFGLGEYKVCVGLALASQVLVVVPQSSNEYT